MLKPVSYTHLDVYKRQGIEAVAAAARSIPSDADLIVLDCIGYTVEMKERVQALTGKSVLLPRTLAARVVKELA